MSCQRLFAVLPLSPWPSRSGRLQCSQVCFCRRGAEKGPSSSRIAGTAATLSIGELLFGCLWLLPVARADEECA
jgi:hypothetical protein